MLDICDTKRNKIWPLKHKLHFLNEHADRFGISVWISDIFVKLQEMLLHASTLKWHYLKKKSARTQNTWSLILGLSSTQFPWISPSTLSKYLKLGKTGNIFTSNRRVLNQTISNFLSKAFCLYDWLFSSTPELNSLTIPPRTQIISEFQSPKNPDLWGNKNLGYFN